MAMCIRYLCGFQYYCYMLCFAVLFVLLHHHYFNVKLSGDRIKHQDTDPTEWRFNIVIVSFPHTMLCVLCKCQPQFLNIYPTNWFVSVGTIQVTAKKKHTNEFIESMDGEFRNTQILIAISSTWMDEFAYKSTVTPKQSAYEKCAPICIKTKLQTEFLCWLNV